MSPEMKPEDFDLKNGANLIVVDNSAAMLVVREKTRKQMWMLPGGEVERGEVPSHAAQSETEEETGIITDSADFRLVALLVQRPKGVVFLYETRHYRGDIVVPAHSLEVQEAKFMTLAEIVSEAKAERFRTGYVRMILRYMRCVHGIDPIPYEGSLRDEVDFPADLDFATYHSKILSA